LKRIGIGLIAALILILLAAPTQAPAQSAGPVTITLQFAAIRQGTVGLVRVAGEDLAEVRAVFQERVFQFYPDQAGFTGLISAAMEQDVGTYNMQVWVRHGDGTAERIDQDVQVNYGEFGRFDIILPASMMPLLQPDINQAEKDKLFNIAGRFTPERYYTEGFILPSAAEQIGWFGTWRLYNQSFWYQHTGLDMKMAIGTPIVAAASGRVMLSEMVAIRGGFVLIDHGWGIYTGYAHLSERYVVPGQWVKQGDVLGLSGLNGRSSGAHLHWEVMAGGVWVDPLTFLDLGLIAGS